MQNHKFSKDIPINLQEQFENNNIPLSVITSNNNLSFDDQINQLDNFNLRKIIFSQSKGILKEDCVLDQDKHSVIEQISYNQNLIFKYIDEIKNETMN